MKVIDAIGLALIAIGVAMTILLYMATYGPSVEVRDLTIQEIPAPSPPGGRSHDRIRSAS